MQTLLDDIELDIQELKCLMQAVTTDTNPTLRIVAKRNIQQMRARLDALQKLLDETPVVEFVAPAFDNVISKDVESVSPQTVKKELPKPVTSESTKAIKPVVHTDPEPVTTTNSTSSILGERIKSATDLRHAISLNDSFRFAREIFGGNTTRMNEIIHQLGDAPSLDKALELFSSTVNPDEENEAVIDFVELLKKYFS